MSEILARMTPRHLPLLTIELNLVIVICQIDAKNIGDNSPPKVTAIDKLATFKTQLKHGQFFKHDT